MVTTEVREATDAELAAIYRANAEHVVGAVDGKAVAYASFRRIDGRLWGMFGMLAPVARTNSVKLFYPLRQHMYAKNEPVFGLAQDDTSERLLRLIGLQPTDEVYAGKKVWIWIPEHFSL